MAQSAHRDNLSDESSSGGLMAREGVSKATLQVAPHLAQQLVKEQALRQQNALHNVPRMGPPTLGPGTSMPTMGLGNLIPPKPRSDGGNGDNQ